MHHGTATPNLTGALSMSSAALALQGCIAEVALAGLLAYSVTDTSVQMSHSASVAAIILVGSLHSQLVSSLLIKSVNTLNSVPMQALLLEILLCDDQYNWLFTKLSSMLLGGAVHGQRHTANLRLLQC